MKVNVYSLEVESVEERGEDGKNKTIKVTLDRHTILRRQRVQNKRRMQSGQVTDPS